MSTILAKNSSPVLQWNRWLATCHRTQKNCSRTTNFVPSRKRLFFACRCYLIFFSRIMSLWELFRDTISYIIIAQFIASDIYTCDELVDNTNTLKETIFKKPLKGTHHCPTASTAMYLKLFLHTIFFLSPMSTRRVINPKYGICRTVFQKKIETAKTILSGSRKDLVHASVNSSSVLSKILWHQPFRKLYIWDKTFCMHIVLLEFMTDI